MFEEDVCAHAVDFLHLLPQPSFGGGIAFASVFVFLDGGRGWMVHLVEICQFLTASAVLIENAFATIREMITAAVVALGDAYFARAVLACFAELLVVLIVVSFSTFLASEHVRRAIIVTVPPDQALEAHRVYLFIDPPSARAHGARKGHHGIHKLAPDIALIVVHNSEDYKATGCSLCFADRKSVV